MLNKDVQPPVSTLNPPWPVTGETPLSGITPTVPETDSEWEPEVPVVHGQLSEEQAYHVLDAFITRADSVETGNFSVMSATELRDLRREMAFAPRGDTRVAALSQAALNKTGCDDIWFIGDIHGDLFGMLAVMAYIEAHSPDACLVFLGDLIDRGPQSAAVMLALLERIAEKPGRTCILGGNHDLGLFYAEGDASEPFRSLTHPAEYTGFLNSRAATNTDLCQLGRRSVDLFAQSLYALFLPGGIMAAHAGIPLGDRWKTITTIDGMDRPECRQDFCWTRITENAPRRAINRRTMGSNFGFLDFFEFCRIATAALNLPVRRLIRGHDHVARPERYSVPGKWRNRVITLTNMCYWEDETFPICLPYTPKPAVVRYTSSGEICIHVVEVPPPLVETAYGAALVTSRQTWQDEAISSCAAADGTWISVA